MAFTEKRLRSFNELMADIKRWVLVDGGSNSKTYIEMIFKNIPWYKKLLDMNCSIIFDEEEDYYIVCNDDWVSCAGKRAGITFYVEKEKGNFYVKRQTWNVNHFLLIGDKYKLDTNLIQIFKESLLEESIADLREQFEKAQTEEFENIFINKKYKNKLIDEQSKVPIPVFHSWDKEHPFVIWFSEVGGDFEYEKLEAPCERTSVVELYVSFEDDAKAIAGKLTDDSLKGVVKIPQLNKINFIEV